MAEMCWVTFPGVGWLVGRLVGYILLTRERGVADAYIHVGEKQRGEGGDTKVVGEAETASRQQSNRCG